MEENETSADMEENPPTASEMLIAARESLGLSQKDVADHLRLITNFIVYIDEGSFEKIPKSAFIKGYLRSYAKVVQLSGDEIVARYDSVLQAEEESIKFRNVTDETVGSVKFTGPVLQAGLLGLLGIVVVVGLVWWISSAGEEPELTVVVSQPHTLVETPENTPLTEQAAIDIDLKNSVDDRSASKEEILSDVAASEAAGGLMEGSEIGEALEEDNSDVEGEVVDPVRDQLPGSISKEVSLVRNSDGDRVYITLDAGGIDEIEVTFTAECWLEIEDGNGDSIYGDLNRAGEVLKVYGIAPFELLFGRATEVSLVFNGKKIDIGRFTQIDKTAKVTLKNSPERF